MAIVTKLLFTKKQLQAFSLLLRTARQAAGMSQLEVARAAFSYRRSHCKVSRIERAKMPKVDALAIERIAAVFGIPRVALEAIDDKFSARAAITAVASKKGFWGYSAALV